MSLKFYTAPRSRGSIIRWILEEADIDYETEVLDFKGSLKSPEYLAINPMGKVPAVSHNGTIITESAAICTYIADTFPKNELAPKIDSPLRGTYYRWLFFAAGPLEAAITSKILDINIPSEKQIFVGFGNFEKTIEAAKTAIKNGPYILGDKFSAADVYFGLSIIFGMRFGGLPKDEIFENYINNLMQREAYKIAMEKEAALISA